MKEAGPRKGAAPAQGDDALTPWLQLQALYAQQIAELGRAHPDLTLIAGLAARAEQLLARLARAQALRPPQAPERIQVKAAAAAAGAMLARTRSLFERLRQRRLEQARRRERAISAALAYRGQGAATAPRFLDLRR